MEWLTFIIGCVVALWLLNRWRLRNYMKIINKIPSNKIYTIIGFGPLISKNCLLKYINDNCDKYGSKSILWIGPIPIFVAYDLESIRDVLTSEKTVNKPALFYKGLEHVIQKGLITNNDPIWSPHRKLFNKAFSYTNLVGFLPIFNRTTDYLIKQMDTILSNGTEFDMKILFRELTINNSAQTNLKRNLTLTKHDLNYYAKCLNSILDLMVEMSVNHLWAIGILRKLAELTIFKTGYKEKKDFEHLFAESVELVKDKNTDDPSYLPDVKATIDYALEGVNQKILNNQEVEWEMLTLFAAAFETTATTLNIIVVLLAMYPEIQQRAYEEIIDIVSESELNYVTLEHIDQMVYLGMIINESMRIFPVIPFIMREVTKSDFNLTNGITLPKGQHVLVNIYNLHRSKTIWGPNADKFNPDNFLPANLESKDTYAFIPFSKGSRNCIGSKYAQINTKIILAKLLRAYKFTTDFKYENMVPEFNVTLKFLEQPKLQAHRR